MELRDREILEEVIARGAYRGNYEDVWTILGIEVGLAVIGALVFLAIRGLSVP